MSLTLDDAKTLVLALMQSSVGPLIVVAALFYMAFTGLLTMHETAIIGVNTNLTSINQSLDRLVQLMERSTNAR